MYFPYSFKQYYLSKAAGQTTLPTGGTPSDLTAGQIGMFPVNAFGIESVGTATGTSAPFVMAMGSWHTVDILNPSIGGLKEPMRSKVINPRLITMFTKQTAVTAQNQVVSIGWNQTSASTTGPLFYCGTPYYLKINLEGSPALWFLDKQMYNNLDAWGGCCSSDCSSGCTSTAADAACVMLQWKDRITQNPILNAGFVTPQVYIQTSGLTRLEVFSAYDVQLDPTKTTYVCNTSNPGAVVASFQLTVAYAETRFGTCTFTPTDHYEIEPLIINASLVSQTGDPCAFNTTINTSVPNMFTQLTAPRQVIGLGEAAVRDLILSQRYRLDNFPDSLDDVNIMRMREIEDEAVLPNVTRTGLYDVYTILFNIARNSNSTGIKDNDQYSVMVLVPTAANMTGFTNFISAALVAAGSSVSLVTI